MPAEWLMEANLIKVIKNVSRQRESVHCQDLVSLFSSVSTSHRFG